MLVLRKILLITNKVFRYSFFIGGIFSNRNNSCNRESDKLSSCSVGHGNERDGMILTNFDLTSW